jgi:hypothetical protein
MNCSFAQIKLCILIGLYKRDIIIYTLWNECMKQQLKAQCLYVCPLCLPSKIYSNDYVTEFNPLYASDLEFYSFTSKLNLCLHLNYTHKLQAPLTFKFVDWLDKYKLRGKNGLIEGFVKSQKKLHKALEEYWNDENRQLHNNLVTCVRKKEHIFVDNAACFRLGIDLKQCQHIWSALNGEFFEDGQDFVHIDLEDMNSSSEDEDSFGG